jgi:hypothetical protein
MADISKCANPCPNAANCYRHTAPSSDYQWIQEFDWTISGKGVICDGYWQISGMRHATGTGKEPT